MWIQPVKAIEPWRLIEPDHLRNGSHFFFLGGGEGRRGSSSQLLLFSVHHLMGKRDKWHFPKFAALDPPLKGGRACLWKGSPVTTRSLSLSLTSKLYVIYFSLFKRIVIIIIEVLGKEPNKINDGLAAPFPVLLTERGNANNVALHTDYLSRKRMWTNCLTAT